MILIFLATFIYVSLKAFQQLNVVGGHYYLVSPVSFGMALCEVTIIVQVVNLQFWAFIPIESNKMNKVDIKIFIMK